MLFWFVSWTHYLQIEVFPWSIWHPPLWSSNWLTLMKGSLIPSEESYNISISDIHTHQASFSDWYYSEFTVNGRISGKAVTGVYFIWLIWGDEGCSPQVTELPHSGDDKEIFLLSCRLRPMFLQTHCLVWTKQLFSPMHSEWSLYVLLLNRDS